MRRLIPGGLWWGAALLACIATALAALNTPVRLSEEGAKPAPSDVLVGEAPEVVSEDLSAFMANRRWGISLNELLEAEAAPPSPPPPPRPPEQSKPRLNPELAKMGYVGLIVAEDRTSVLLVSPEGGIARLMPGDTLPDGRTLVSVTDNSLMLKSGTRPVEVLTLFPPVGE